MLITTIPRKGTRTVSAGAVSVLVFVVDNNHSPKGDENLSQAVIKSVFASIVDNNHSPKGDENGGADTLNKIIDLG